MIKVSIIEDHSDYKESLKYIINNTEGIQCIADFSSVESALENLPESDVLLLDINLPGLSGLEAIEKIKEIYPNTNIIMLTVFDDSAHIFNAILKGADGYLLKKTHPLRILQAIEDAAAGGSPMSPSIAKQALHFMKNYISLPKEDILSIREKEVLNLIVESNNNEEIANKLFISKETVRNHIRNIYKKLQVHSKSQAVAKALKENLI